MTLELSPAARDGLRELQETCGLNSFSKGFHDDRPSDPQMLRHWQGNRLMLIVSEAVEAQEEIRKGKDSDETYYPLPPLPSSLVAEIGDVEKAAESFANFLADKPQKPEGVPSEIADIVIRCFDFAYTEGFSLADIIEEKLKYNASRERLHGGKKF